MMQHFEEIWAEETTNRTVPMATPKRGSETEEKLKWEESVVLNDCD